MISIIIPSCFRPKMFRKVLNSLVENSGNNEIELIAVIDKDVETWDVAMEFGCRVNFSQEMRGALTCWNEGLSMSNGDIIHPSMDDLIYHKGWLDYALESHRSKLDGYGVVGMNDLAYNGNTQLATQFMFDRRFCIDHLGGVIAPPVYNYFCIDSEINARAKSLGKFYWDERSVVEHVHVAHGKRAFDQHDQTKIDNNWMEIDNIIFESRKAQGFPVTWEPKI